MLEICVIFFFQIQSCLWWYNLISCSLCSFFRTSSILSKDHPPDKKPKSDKNSVACNEFDPTGNPPPPPPPPIQLTTLTPPPPFAVVFTVILCCHIFLHRLSSPLLLFSYYSALVTASHLFPSIPLTHFCIFSYLRFSHTTPSLWFMWQMCEIRSWRTAW